jgi:hypothetical protein
MKICPIGAELFYADGWMDMKKLTVSFRNLTKAPKYKAIQQNKYLRFYYFFNLNCGGKFCKFQNSDENNRLIFT